MYITRGLGECLGMLSRKAGKLGKDASHQELPGDNLKEMARLCVLNPLYVCMLFFVFNYFYK